MRRVWVLILFVSSGMDYSYDEGSDSLNYSLWNLSDNTDYDYNNTSRDWCEAGEHEFTIKTFKTCVFCLVFLLGMVGNCLVIATFARYRRLQLRSMTDIFLFHLALADLLLLFTLPIQVVDTYLGWIFSVALCKVTRAGYAVNTYSGLLLLACISIDRYMVVARAQVMLKFRHQILTGGKMAAVGVWVMAVLLSLPEILFSGVAELTTEETQNFYCGTLKSTQVKMVANGVIIAVICLSLTVMVTCYTLIAKVLYEGKAQQRRKGWQRQRTLKLMVALVLVFVSFQLPYAVVLSRKMAGQFCGLLVEYVTCTLAYARCCLNPILYALVGVRFRADVFRFMHDLGCLCNIQQATGSASMSPSSPALTGLCSPTNHERSYSSNEVDVPTIFMFPGPK